VKDTPPTYFFICAIVAALPYFLLTQFNIITFPLNLGGVVLFLMGLVLNFLATQEFEKYNTPHNFAAATAVVSSGVYRFSRNPIYLGMILSLVGLAILFQNPAGLLAPILFYLVVEFRFIPFEEEKIAREIGEDYQQYKQRVRRWL
jgi:protein-S-isoprenylcysteine O-methyltransferase Ste14